MSSFLFVGQFQIPLIEQVQIEQLMVDVLDIITSRWC